MMDVDDSKTDPDPRLDEMGDDTKIEEDLSKPRYRSWKKKYRKMRIVYDSKVFESEELHKKELKGIETAKRLAIENDRILDILYDINESPQIPTDKRIAVSSDKENLEESIRPAKTLKELEATVPHLTAGECRKAGKLDDIEHPSTLPNADPDARPPSFLTADDIDNYLFEIDSRIGGPGANLPTLAPLAHHGKRAEELSAGTGAGAAGGPSAATSANGAPASAPAHSAALPPSTAATSSSSSYQLRNPASVYNWLRKHCPQVFLQDSEKDAASAAGGPSGGKDKDDHHHAHKDIGAGADKPDKSSGKTKTPSTARGGAGGTRASKRATKAAAARAGSMDVDADEDNRNGGGGGTPAPAATTGRGKRKRVVDDDPGYRPKGGSSRPTKKKRKNEGADTPTVKRPRKNKKELSEEIVRDVDMEGDGAGDDE